MVAVISSGDRVVAVTSSGQKVTHRTGNCLQSFPNQATHGTGWKQNLRSNNPELLPQLLQEDHKD